jgi:hypothetical protein
MHGNMATPMSEDKFQMHVDNDVDDSNRLIKSRYLPQYRSYRWTSLIIPCLLGLLIIIGASLLILTVNRRTTCRIQQTEKTETTFAHLSDESVSKT